MKLGRKVEGEGHASRRAEVGRYLSNAHHTGFSNKAWYLLTDPADQPVIEVAFLNGQESATIETAEADFQVLGVHMRGYHAFDDRSVLPIDWDGRWPIE